MTWSHFHYHPDTDLDEIFHKILELRDCKIYVSKHMFIRFLQYVNDFTGYCYEYTGILKFPKLNKIIQESNRVRDGIFYVDKD
jgi:hypothetical protein